MSSGTQKLLDNFPTVGTILAGIVRRNSNRCTRQTPYRNIPTNFGKPTKPHQISTKTKFPIFDHIPHLQVRAAKTRPAKANIGNQVARLDDAGEPTSRQNLDAAYLP
jgi:hypothetical protein